MPLRLVEARAAAISLVLLVGCSGASTSAGLFGASPDAGADDEDAASAAPATDDGSSVVEPGDDGGGDAVSATIVDGGAGDGSSDASLDAGAGPYPTAGCLALYPEKQRASATLVEVPYGEGQVKYVATETTTSPAGQGGVDVRLALCRPGINPALVLVTITPDTTAPFTWVFGPTSPLPGVTHAALVHGPAFDQVWATATFTR